MRETVSTDHGIAVPPGALPDLAVHIEGLFKSFDGRRQVLDDVHLKVPRSAIVSIIGQSGGGKTTLLRCVNLLERPNRGSIEIDGEPIFSGERVVCRSLAKLRQTVGMVFQRFNLFPHLTAVENVMLAQIHGAHIEEQEGGRPLLPDGLPVIDRVPRHDNVFVTTGHAMVGITLAPASGMALTDYILSGRRPSILAPFRFDRFTRRRRKAAATRP
jgi:ABC-type Fe3+/spermidine/putrescine transport system ATPase subunit